MSDRSPKIKKRGSKEEALPEGPASSSSRKDRKKELGKSDGHQLEAHEAILAAFQGQIEQTKNSELLGKRKVEILNEMPIKLPTKSSLKITAEASANANAQAKVKRKLSTLDQLRNKSISPPRGGYTDFEAAYDRKTTQQTEPESIAVKLFGTTSLSKLGNFTPNFQMKLGSHSSSMSLLSEASRTIIPFGKQESHSATSATRPATLPIEHPLHVGISPALATKSALVFDCDSFEELLKETKIVWVRYYMHKFVMGPNPIEELQLPPLSSNKFWQAKTLFELSQRPQVKQYLHRHYSRSLEDTLLEPGFETKLLYGDKSSALLTIKEGAIRYLGKFGMNQIIREEKRWEAGVLISAVYDQLKASYPSTPLNSASNQPSSTKTDNVQLGKLSVYSRRKKAIPEESDESGSDDNQSDSGSNSSSSSAERSDESSDEEEEEQVQPKPVAPKSDPRPNQIPQSQRSQVAQPMRKESGAARKSESGTGEDTISKANYFITKLNSNHDRLMSEMMLVKNQFEKDTFQKQDSVAQSHGQTQGQGLRQDDKSVQPNRAKIFNKSPSEEKDLLREEQDTREDGVGHSEEGYYGNAVGQTDQGNMKSKMVGESSDIQIQVGQVKLEDLGSRDTGYSEGEQRVSSRHLESAGTKSGQHQTISLHNSTSLESTTRGTPSVVKIEPCEPKDAICVDKKAKQSTQKVVRKLIESAVGSAVGPNAVGSSGFLKEAIRNASLDSYSSERIVGFDTQMGPTIPGMVEHMDSKRFRRVRRKMSFTITLERDEYLPEDFQETPEPAPVQQQQPDGSLHLQSLGSLNLGVNKPMLGKRDPLDRPVPQQPVVSESQSVYRHPMVGNREPTEALNPSESVPPVSNCTAGLKSQEQLIAACSYTQSMEENPRTPNQTHSDAPLEAANDPAQNETPQPAPVLIDAKESEITPETPQPQEPTN